MPPPTGAQNSEAAEWRPDERQIGESLPLLQKLHSQQRKASCAAFPTQRRDAWTARAAAARRILDSPRAIPHGGAAAGPDSRHDRERHRIETMAIVSVSFPDSSEGASVSPSPVSADSPAGASHTRYAEVCAGTHDMTAHSDKTSPRCRHTRKCDRPAGRLRRRGSCLGIMCHNRFIAVGTTLFIGVMRPSNKTKTCLEQRETEPRAAMLPKRHVPVRRDRPSVRSRAA